MTANSGYSNVSTATTLGGLPAAPTNLTAAAGSTGSGMNKRRVFIDLAWSDNASEESSYVVERCQGSSCRSFAELITLGANVTTFRDTSLLKRTSYRYPVKARNAAGDSGHSNVARATTP